MVNLKNIENKINGGFSVGSPQRGLQPCTTKGGAEEPRSGIFPKVKPRSFIDVMRADDLRSVDDLRSCEAAPKIVDDPKIPYGNYRIMKSTEDVY
jgi:hypothetical protein